MRVPTIPLSPLRRLGIIALAVACLAAVAGCSDDTRGAGGTVAATTTPGESTGPLPAALENDDPGLGSLEFTLDTAGAVSGTTSAEELVLTVADPHGGQWVLTVPGDPAREAEAITVTPFATVAATGGELDGGLMLEPDGFWFTTPALLEYRPAAGGEAPVLYLADHDGGHLSVAPLDDAGRAVLDHFSLAAAGGPLPNPTLNPNDLVAAAAAFDEVLRAAEALLHTRPLPEVPDRPLTGCQALSHWDWKEAADLILAFYDPWARDLAVVLTLWQSLQSIAAQYGESPDLDRGYGFERRVQALYYAYRRAPADQANLAMRIFDRAADHSPDKYFAMEIAVPSLPLPDEAEPWIMVDDERNLAALREWGQHVLEPLIDRIYDQRAYSLLDEVIRIGAKTGGISEPMASKLSVALSFDVDVHVTVASNSLGIPTHVEADLTASRMEVVPESLIPSSPALQVKLEGEGTITEIGGTIAFDTNRGDSFSMPTLDVPTRATIVLDPCGQAEVDANPWGTNEPITMTSGTDSLTMPYPGTGLVDSAVRMALLANPDGLVVTIADGQEEFQASTSLAYTEADVQVTLGFEVTLTFDGRDPRPASGD